MRNEPIELVGSVRVQLTDAAMRASEQYMMVSGLDHKGYDESQIDALLIEDLEKSVDRAAVLRALEVFRENIPGDLPKLTDDALRTTLLNALYGLGVREES